MKEKGCLSKRYADKSSQSRESGDGEFVFHAVYFQVQFEWFDLCLSRWNGDGLV